MIFLLNAGWKRACEFLKSPNIWLLPFILLWFIPISGESSEDLDDILGGFDDQGLEDVAVSITSEPSDFNMDGYFKLGSSYNIDHPGPNWHGLSRLRFEAQLDLKFKPSAQFQAVISGKHSFDLVYGLEGRSQFSEDVLDSNEFEFELKETYFQARLSDNFDLKCGRQIVVWGQADSIRITDVLNPLDLREPGLTDIEDLRRPVAMSRLDFYHGPWALTGLAIHEIRFNKNPEFGSDFYPFTSPPPHEFIPADNFASTEWGAAVSLRFRGGDAALYFAKVFDDQAHLTLQSGMAMHHARTTMIGAASNFTRGNWLFKMEGAYFDGLRFFYGADDYSRIDLLGGCEYYGITKTTISVEAANRHLYHYDHKLAQAPDGVRHNQFEGSVRLDRNFLNQTLDFTIMLLFFGHQGEDGHIQRISILYDFTDDFSINGGLVLYHSGDLPAYSNMGENDRIFCEIKFSF